MMKGTFSALAFIFLLLAGCKSSKVVAPVKLKAFKHQISSSQSETSLNNLDFSRLKPLLQDTLTIIGVGDIMLGTNFPGKEYLPPANGRALLEAVKGTLADADLTFGNHEGVILNDGGDPKYCSNRDLCYLFRSPEFLTPLLVDAGFDVLSLANNHAGDFGNPGRDRTMQILDSLGLHNAGVISRPYSIFNVNGVKYGFAAFAPNTGTVSINDLDNAIKIVQQLEKESDIVIVSFHGGAEGSKYERVTREREIFYGENRGNVYEFAHTVIDHGADIVFGHGPHVTRAMEVYKNRFIAYSLGNFCTYARFNLKGVNGIAPIVKLYTDYDGKFLKGRIFPILQEGEGIPVIDTSKKVIFKLQELLKEDFPESQIQIDNQGFVTYIQSSK